MPSTKPAQSPRLMELLEKSQSLSPAFAEVFSNAASPRGVTVSGFGISTRRTMSTKRR